MSVSLSVVALAFSPDGRTLAIAVGGWTSPGFEPEQIHLWDVHSGQLLRSMQGHDDQIYGIAFDRERLATGSGGRDKTIKLWDPDTGGLMERLSGHTGIIYSLAFAPDGRTLASGSGDGTVRLWTDLSARSQALLG